jgi:hypothetical protein
VANLYLEDIFSESSKNPSSLHIGFPVAKKDGNSNPDVEVLTGLLASEPTIATGNKWGPILNDVSTLSFFGALAGMKSLPSWIGASAQCWKGTNPLSINLDFYLINYKKGLNLERKLKALTKLTSLTLDRNSLTSVFVHGGYKVDPFSTNASRFNNTIADNVKNGQPYSEEAQKEYADSLRSTWTDFVKTTNQYLLGSESTAGTVAIDIGNKLRISKLLVANINVTPSIVEVPDNKPLYYHVTMALHGCRPLVSDDIDEIYKG